MHVNDGLYVAIRRGLDRICEQLNSKEGYPFVPLGLMSAIDQLLIGNFDGKNSQMYLNGQTAHFNLLRTEGIESLLKDCNFINYLKLLNTIGDFSVKNVERVRREGVISYRIYSGISIVTPEDIQKLPLTLEDLKKRFYTRYERGITPHTTIHLDMSEKILSRRGIEKRIDLESFRFPDILEAFLPFARDNWLGYVRPVNVFLRDADVVLQVKGYIDKGIRFVRVFEVEDSAHFSAYEDYLAVM